MQCVVVSIEQYEAAVQEENEVTSDNVENAHMHWLKQYNMVLLVTDSSDSQVGQELLLHPYLQAPPVDVHNKTRAATEYACVSPA